MSNLETLLTWLAARPRVEPPDARKLRKQLVGALARAFDEDVLVNPLHDIERLVKTSTSHGNHLIVGGREPTTGGANFRRDPSLPHFRRADGAWFDFAITLTESSPRLIVAYNFELRYGLDDDRFMRLDLNPSGHANADSESGRSHIHASTDD